MQGANELVQANVHLLEQDSKVFKVGDHKETLLVNLSDLYMVGFLCFPKYFVRLENATIKIKGKGSNNLIRKMWCGKTGSYGCM